uniref:Uncharacterized protein n=1 Tax=Cannabis sativa TaxID=3483 RepID=A0A803QDZ9_CANSA
MLLVLEPTNKFHLESHASSLKTPRRPIPKLYSLAKLWLIYNKRSKTHSTDNTNRSNNGSWRNGRASKANGLNRNIGELTCLNRSEKLVTLNAKLPLCKGLFELNTTTMPKNCASTKKTPGAKAPRKEANFKQESERTQTLKHDCQGKRPLLGGLL